MPWCTCRTQKSEGNLRETFSLSILWVLGIEASSRTELSPRPDQVLYHCLKQNSRIVMESKLLFSCVKISMSGPKNRTSTVSGAVISFLSNLN